ncbi:MAG TPA: hypothetical protein VN732_03330 [Solirubrobacterales bacterium]|nr:hypothetical protein [Solirubrobacterales bacterium]
MFQALDQFEVEKLGREVRRGQTENTRQGYRNGGRAPYGYRLRHEPHPDPARARPWDMKSRLVRDTKRLHRSPLLEHNLITLVDAFFGTRVFGPERVEHFRGQASALMAEEESNGSAERERAGDQLADGS